MKYSTIRSFLDNHQKIDYIQKCVRRINNERFIGEVLGLNDNPMMVEFETLGSLNKDKNIYIFENMYETFGFFAVYRLMLNTLYFSKRFNLIPVVNYTSNFAYAENDKINGTSNPYEYYFSQVSQVSLEEAHSSYNVIRYKNKHNKFAEELNDEGGYAISDSYIEEMAQITKKYIRLNTYVEPIINNDIAAILRGKKTLGVHYRGTDFKQNFNGHPIQVSALEYIDFIQNAIADYEFEQIFLATDEKATVDLFEKTFGDRLVYYKDVVRSDQKVSVALSGSERKHNKYLLGLEVLRDMFTLAACDGLIAGLSQVSMCARITKASYDKKYEYEQIIDKGINNNKKNYSNYHHKKQLKILKKDENKDKLDS